jgi:hypothetical protein
MDTGDKQEPAPSSSLGAPEVVEVRAGVFKDTCLSFPDQVNERGRSPAWWPRAETSPARTVS